MKNLLERKKMCPNISSIIIYDYNLTTPAAKTYVRGLQTYLSVGYGIYYIFYYQKDMKTHFLSQIISCCINYKCSGSDFGNLSERLQNRMND